MKPDDYLKKFVELWKSATESLSGDDLERLAGGIEEAMFDFEDGEEFV